MRKNKSTLYFEKRYCLLVHSLTLTQRVSLTAFSLHSAEQETIDRSSTYNLNQIVYISCVNLVCDGTTTADSQPTLHFTTFGGRQYQRNDLAEVRFDMNTEKIVKPESSLLFSKELEGGRGTLNYKFINLKTRTLSQEEFEANRVRRHETAVDFGHDEANLKIEELMHFLQQKDELIGRLQDRIDDLISDNRKRNQSGQRDGVKDRQISLNVKVNAANEHTRRENERLINTLRDQNERVIQLEEQVKSLTTEKETLEREINMCKKQLKDYQGIHSLSKSKVVRRSVNPGVNALNPGVNPSFLRSSTIDPLPMKQSYAEYSNVIVEPRLRHSMVQESENSQNNLKQSTFRSNMRHSHVVNSQAGSNSASNPPANSKNKASGEDEDGLPDSLPGEEGDLQKRISSQKEDYKFRSIIFDRMEEIDILKKKLELRVAEVKGLEKELEKSKVQLKKKEVEIRELRKQSRKNLFFGDSNKDLGGGARHRVEIEQEFDRLQNEHDREKITLQQEIQHLERENEEKGKELKKIRLQLEQSRAHEKTYESKYNEIKVNMNKNVEDYIEYKEKAQQYDNAVLKNKELEGSIKALDIRINQFEAQNKRMEAVLAKNNARWSEREKEWEKLKKIEREFDYMKGQNINLRQSIESYESRYNELKRYCQKLQVAYNRFVTAKRRSGTESKLFDDGKEDKEIQEKFVELSRKVNDCQINYYKQQLEDLNEEKSFAMIYFDRKLRDEKDKIYESKSFSEEEKRAAILAKEQEIQRNIAEKMDEINSKILKLEKTFGEANQRLSESGQHSFVLSIPDKMKLIERKLSMMMDREQERIAERHNLKETILQISQELKMKPSASAVEMKRINSNNIMSMSMIGDKLKEHYATVEEAKQKSEQSQQRVYEQTRQKNNNLIKQNGDLKMKNQKLTLEMQKIERKTQEREKTLEATYKKMEDTNRYKIDALSEKVENVQKERDYFKTQLAESQKSIETLTEQLKSLSQGFENKQRQIMDLQQKIMKFEERVRDYQHGERQMMQEVAIIKKTSQQNQQDLVHLMQQRNNSFMKIQRTKEMEIEKLLLIIKETELKLEAEMMENMQHRDKIQSMKETLDCTSKENQERIQQLTVAIENKEREFDEIFIKDYQLAKENEVLQTNLIDISNDISNKEIEIAELSYQLVSANKQTQIYKSQAAEFSSIQRKLREQIKNLESIVDDKIYQLKFFQEKMVKFRQDVEMSAKEMERIQQMNFQLDNDNKQHKEEYMVNREEIIKLKEHISLIEIDFKKQEMYLEDVEKANEQLKHHVEELQAEVTRLNDINNQLTISRKKSSDKEEIASPGRKKITKKLSTSLDVPEVSSIGQGNITPIIPVSPHLLSRRLENPFEPRSNEDQNLGRSNLRKTSIEAAGDQSQSLNQTNIEYAINVEEPRDLHQASRHVRETSTVEIELDEPEEIRNSSRQPSFFRSLLPSNNSNMNTLQIEEEESNQQNTVNFGRNIDLGDSKQQNVDHDIDQYIEKINELKRQLFQSNQENERLSHQIAELEKQNEELMQNLQPLQLLQPQISKKSSLNVSRRRTLELTAFGGRPEMAKNQSNTEKHVQDKNMSQDDKILRSQSGFNLHSSRDYVKLQNNLGNYTELQQKYEQAEVQLQYLTDAFNSVKAELEEHAKNNEKLIEEAEFCRETIQQLEERIEESNFEVEQYKKFQVFEQMYQNEVNKGKELVLQMEELHMQTFQKDEKMTELIKENSELMQQINAYRGEANETEDERMALHQKIKDLTNHINKLKIEYRKYEEESELEIIHLKETVDGLKDKMKVKEEELLALGEKFIDLQSKLEEMHHELELKDKDLSKKDHNSSEAEHRYQDLEDEIQKIEESRQNLFKRVRQLQQELNLRNDNISEFSKETALTLKKYEIKLQSKNEELVQANNKLTEKQKVISLLKNQIGLYNQQCDQLKKSNDELSYEFNKVEKELKDIMRVYEKELEELRAEVAIKDDHIGKLTHLIKEKQHEYGHVFKQIRSVEKERDQYKSDYVELQSGIDRLKQAKARQYSEVFTQLQLKNNEYEKVKASFDKVSLQLKEKEERESEQVQKYENKMRGYREKLQHYERMMEEFEGQLKKLGKRPTSDQYQQILFENEVLRNRIEQLESDMTRADSQKSQELVYMQFRKYKANKEREILDLEAEMQKYGVKINQLEEAVFYLKKENESLKRENFELSDIKEEALIECEDLKESLTDMEKELLFYKNRKMLDIQMLLNETNQ